MASRKSTPTTIPATEVHRNFSDLIRRAFSGREHFIVEKDGLPVVAIISKQEYDELVKEHEQRESDRDARLKQFQEAARAIGTEVANSGLSEEELMAKLEEVRQRRYEDNYGRKPAG